MCIDADTNFGPPLHTEQCTIGESDEQRHRLRGIGRRQQVQMRELWSTQKSCEIQQGRIATTRQSDLKYGCRLMDLADTTSLPPQVLHFSLLRFVFDPKKMERKKSNATILYPKSINMGQFLGDRHSSNQEVWYDLQGALLHKGTSAYHGHYVANIFDAR